MACNHTKKLASEQIELNWVNCKVLTASAKWQLMPLKTIDDVPKQSSLHMNTRIDS